MTWLDDLYLDRGLWGANPLHCTAGTYLGAGAFQGAVVHHDVIPFKATDNAADVARHARRVQTIRPDLPGNVDGSPEAPYSFGFGRHTDPNKAWRVELRGAGRSGAHTAGYNFTRYGFVIFGDHTDEPLTPGLIAAIRYQAWLLFGDRKVEQTLGHRDTVATGCPGDAVYAQLSALQPPFTSPINPEDDMNVQQLAAALGGSVVKALDGSEVVFFSITNSAGHARNVDFRTLAEDILVNAEVGRAHSVADFQNGDGGGAAPAEYVGEITLRPR